MGYSLELTLAIESTDSNKLLGRHWTAKKTIFDRVKNEIYYLSRGKLPKKPLKEFKLSFHRYSARTLDWDNYVASLKAYIDGLRLAGIIEDDNWNFIQSANTDQTVSKERKLVILIEECI